MLYFKLFKDYILDEYHMSEISTYRLFIATALETVNSQITVCFGGIFRQIPVKAEVMLEEIKSLLEAGGVKMPVTHSTSLAHWIHDISLPFVYSL